jgi:hypothetical protein
MLLRAAIALLTASIACGDDPLAPACNGPVDVHVSGSFPPLISWAPDCSIDQLDVHGDILTDNRTYWRIAAGDRRIESAVRFSQVPRGVIEHAPAVAATSGTELWFFLQSPSGRVVGAVIWNVP